MLVFLVGHDHSLLAPNFKSPKCWSIFGEKKRKLLYKNYRSIPNHLTFNSLGRDWKANNWEVFESPSSLLLLKNTTGMAWQPVKRQKREPQPRLRECAFQQDPSVICSLLQLEKHGANPSVLKLGYTLESLGQSIKPGPHPQRLLLKWPQMQTGHYYFY